MFTPSRIELCRAALRSNIRFLKRIIGPSTRYSSVIKGNAYGHGITHFVPLAESCGVEHFSVFSADEALTAIESRTREETRVMIMGAIDDAELEWAVENDIAFWIFDLDRLEAASRAAGRVEKPARIHLEVETGLNRTGLELDELSRVLQRIRAEPEHFRIEGLCTHYAGAESQANYLRIQRQIQRFFEASVHLTDAGLDLPPRHSACSAAAMVYPQTRMEMCRFGIMQYGLWPSLEVWMDFLQQRSDSGHPRSHDPLRRVMRWSSRVMGIKTVEQGQHVGYGTSYLTTRRERLAAVPVGYSHGFARDLSNLGHVLVRGKRAGVVGLVNMNAIMIDVTHIPGVTRGDEVVLIGKQGRAQVTVSSFSDLIRNVNYEVLVRLPSEIPRVVVD